MLGFLGRLAAGSLVGVTVGAVWFGLIYVLSGDKDRQNLLIEDSHLAMLRIKLGVGAMVGLA